MADPNSAAFGAIVGICTALVICVIALIIFVVVFCNLKIKNDNNIRKRVVAKDAFDEVRTVEEGRPVIQPPAPVVVPAPLTPVPPRLIPLSRGPTPTPPSPIAVRAREPQRRPSHVRSRSWGAADNDWLFVKKITKRRRRSSGSSSSSSDDSSCAGDHHHSHHHECRRLAPYDLATPMVVPRPVTTGVTPFLVQPFMA